MVSMPSVQGHVYLSDLKPGDFFVAKFAKYDDQKSNPVVQYQRIKSDGSLSKEYTKEEVESLGIEIDTLPQVKTDGYEFKEK